MNKNLHTNTPEWLEQIAGELCLELDHERLIEALRTLRSHQQGEMSVGVACERLEGAPQDVSRAVQSAANRHVPPDEESARAA